MTPRQSTAVPILAVLAIASLILLLAVYVGGYMSQGNRRVYEGPLDLFSETDVLDAGTYWASEDQFDRLDLLLPQEPFEALRLVPLLVFIQQCSESITTSLCFR